MSDREESAMPADHLEKAFELLEKLPHLSQEGFREIGRHIENSSKGFSSGAGRVIYIQERIAADSGLSVDPLRRDMDDLFRKMTPWFTQIEEVTGRRRKIAERLGSIVTWGLEMEQEACLPQIGNLIDARREGGVEHQSLASIIDNLLIQTRPLIFEVITTAQEAINAINQMAKRIEQDLSHAEARFASIQKESRRILERLKRSLGKIGDACQTMEKRSQEVKKEAFRMVQDMQYDDITSQRLHHAMSAVLIIKQRMASGGEGPWIYAALKVVEAQIKASRTDLSASIEEIQGRLSTVADLAVQQVAAISALRNGGRGIQQDLSEMDYNLGALSRLAQINGALTREATDSLTQAEEEVGQVGQVLGALVSIAGQLENFTSSMGDGGAGGSQFNHLRELILNHTRRIQAEREGSEAILAQAEEALGAAREKVETAIPPLLAGTEQILKRLPRLLKNVRRRNGEMIKIMNDTLGDAQAPVVQIMLLVAEMDFHKVIRDKAIQVELILNKAGREALAGAGPEAVAPYAKPEALEELAALFTMAEERRLFAQTLSALAGKEDGEGDEDGFEEVELF